jgi:predicted nucleotidyltransferase
MICLLARTSAQDVTHRFIPYTTAMPGQTPLSPLTTEAITAFCRKHHLKYLAIFGSATTPLFSPTYDLDFLYEFQPGHEPGWAIADIEAELSTLTGRPVDLVPLKHLNPRLQNSILPTAQTLYVA